MNNYEEMKADLFSFVKNESCVNDEIISFDTRLEEDLGMYGDDAIEFMLKYAKQYNVDVTRFEAANYFSSEARSLVWSILCSFFRKESTSKKSLTIRHLYEGIKNGRLDEDIINLSNVH